MRGDGKRRAYAEWNRCLHRGADDHAVDEIVERVAEQHHGRSRAVGLAIVRVAMAPENEFLEEEEQHDAAKQRTQHSPRRKLAECLRQQHEQRHAEQRADRIADEPRNDFQSNSIVEEEEGRSDHDSAETAHQG